MFGHAVSSLGVCTLQDVVFSDDLVKYTTDK